MSPESQDRQELNRSEEKEKESVGAVQTRIWLEMTKTKAFGWGVTGGPSDESGFEKEGGRGKTSGEVGRVK
ncbi:hypothetical protein N7491_002715 [Penicillium cf. griseofulvum]|nr:hypothetical protein N7491_002715 [Penicillium cf. griseofulvum]